MPPLAFKLSTAARSSFTSNLFHFLWAVFFKSSSFYFGLASKFPLTLRSVGLRSGVKSSNKMKSKKRSTEYWLLRRFFTVLRSLVETFDVNSRNVPRALLRPLKYLFDKFLRLFVRWKRGVPLTIIFQLNLTNFRCVV